MKNETHLLQFLNGRIKYFENKRETSNNLINCYQPCGNPKKKYWENKTIMYSKILNELRAIKKTL